MKQEEVQTVWKLRDTILEEAQKMDQDRKLLAKCAAEFRDVC